MLKEDTYISKINIILVLSCAGILLSLYLVKDHYDSSFSACDISSVISCSIVNRSSFSKLMNVPVSVLGVSWFSVLAWLSWMVRANSGYARELLLLLYWLMALFLWNTAGIFFVLYFIVGEIILGAICPSCTVVHVIVLLTFYMSWKLLQEYSIARSVQLKAIKIDWMSFILQMKSAIVLIGCIHLAILIYFNSPTLFYSTSSMDQLQRQLILDKFCKCLSDRAIFMYGSEKCSFCQRQIQLFGTSFAHISYVDCDKNSIDCVGMEITSLPTWIKFSTKTDRERSPTMNNELERHSGVLTLKELAEFSGCQLRSSNEESTNLQ